MLRLSLCLVLSLCWSFCCAVAPAQSAHFSGAQSDVISGLNQPFQVAVDYRGNVYIADTGNSRVLKESPGRDGYTQSIIGSDLLEPYGVAADRHGNVYVADTENNRVLKETPVWGGGYSQSVILSAPPDVPGGALADPIGLAVDLQGDLFIADVFNNRVLRATPTRNGYSFGVVDSIANGVHEPTGVAVDRRGNVYLSTFSTITFPFFEEVLKETPTGSGYAQSLVAGGFQFPYGIAVDAFGDVYVADYDAGAVYEETSSDGGYTQTAIATAGIANPSWVAVGDRNDLYITDHGNNRVVQLNRLGGVFGQEEVGSTSTPISMLFVFDAPGTLGTISVLTFGPGSEFVDLHTGSCTAGARYNAGDSCSVDLGFAPKFIGQWWGAAQIRDSHGRELATGFVMGEGVR